PGCGADDHRLGGRPGGGLGLQHLTVEKRPARTPVGGGGVTMTTPSTVRRSARDRERGDAMVGFVIAFPLAFVLVALLVQAVMVRWADNAAPHAAAAADREARVAGGSDAAAHSLARDLLSQVGFARRVDATVHRWP